MARSNIITFYSYKGGTGRTMALASVASQLASEQFNKKVLVVDWDLEAPGLHLYFEHLIRGAENGASDSIKNLPGLIELFEEIKQRILNIDEHIGEKSTIESLQKIDMDKYIVSTTNPNLSIIKAGAFTDNFAAKINAFDWEELYERALYVYQSFATVIASKGYDYVLIDSRTGVTDSAGVCTMMLPEKLVVVFTPNKQSLTGVEKLIRKAISFRSRSNDLRPLSVFPLVSRVEPSEIELRSEWRTGSDSKDILGYQPRFESLFKEIYNIKYCNLESYFDEILIQQVPNISFGENIVSGDSLAAGDRVLFGRFRSLTQVVTNLDTPWQFGDGHSDDLNLTDLNPYPGLSPYRTEDDIYFANIHDIVGEIGGCFKDDCRIIVLRSPPGTGKTSLLNAATIPALTAEHSQPAAFVETTIRYIDCNNENSDIINLQNHTGMVTSITMRLVVILDHVDLVSASIVSEFIDWCMQTKNIYLIIVEETYQHRQYANSKYLRQNRSTIKHINLSHAIPATQIENIIEGPARLCGVIYEPLLVRQLVDDF